MVITTLDELVQEAERFVGTLSPAQDHAILITLSGELGAGKTAYTQALAKAFGVTDAVTSPTFVLEKEYALNNQAFARLVHIDAYRLEGDTSLVPLVFDELMKDSSTLIVLEWPEKVQSQLPTPTHAITLVAQEDGSRLLSYGS